VSFHGLDLTAEAAQIQPAGNRPDISRRMVLGNEFLYIYLLEYNLLPVDRFETGIRVVAHE